MELKPYGDRGILLAALSESERNDWLCRLDRSLPEGCEEYVVGYDSILLIGQRISEQSLLPLQQLAIESTHTGPAAHRHVIEVSYHGPDLAAVAQACGLTVEQVIQLHCAPIYTVRMMGFSPGFPYLEGLDARLHIDRRASPRNRIEPGSVAIGGSHAGIYSVASPGGWHLLGHTDFTLFDREAARQSNPKPHAVFALSPGDQVCFKAKETH